MPKCVVIDTAVHLGRRPAAAPPWAETIIYEAHVKGMTAARHGHAPSSCAAPSPASPTRASSIISCKLGVTAVELMPVQAFFDDRYLVEKGCVNYWGYNTDRLLRARAALHLAGARHLHEFKVHGAAPARGGIEVILDVVYNHTAEGNQLGPTLSFRGIDNASYYMLGRGPALLLRHDRLRQHASTCAIRACCRW